MAWFGPTGNFAINVDSIPHTRETLEQLTKTTWAVLPASRVIDALGELASLREPSHRPHERVTPGLAFVVTGASDREVIGVPGRVSLRRLTPEIIAIHKLDVLRDNGRLDRTRRRGGWGGCRPRSNARSAVSGLLVAGELSTECVDVQQSDRGIDGAAR